MPFDLVRVNIWAVLVGALIAFVIGGVWYTVLFGKLWVRLQGYSEQKIKEMQAKMSPPRFFGGMLASYLALASALGLMLTALPEPTALTGAAFSLLVWLGCAAIAMTGYIASDKRLGIYLIDAGCQLVYLVLMGVLLGAWR